MSNLLISPVRKLRPTLGADLLTFPGLDPQNPFMIKCDKEQASRLFHPVLPSHNLSCAQPSQSKQKRKAKVRTWLRSVPILYLFDKMERSHQLWNHELSGGKQLGNHLVQSSGFVGEKSEAQKGKRSPLSRGLNPCLRIPSH